MRAGDFGESAVDTRWVLASKTVEGVKKAKARVVAKGLQQPGLKDGIVDTSGYVSLRSCRLQFTNLSALKKGEL